MWTKALEYRQQSSGNGIKPTVKDHDHRPQQILLYSLADQTGDRTELRNQILQALMAAQETTAVLISNVFFLLSRHPAVWQRLRMEVISLGDSELDVDLLQNMRYLHSVLYESKSFQKSIVDIESC